VTDQEPTVPEIIGVDVGGTFTDLVVLDPETGSVRTAKTPTSPAQPADAVMRVLSKAHVDLSRARTFFHGTTLGLNMLLERAGARTGLLTTRGFRDVLEIARASWPRYQLHWEKPAPLVPRFLRRELTERVRANGDVLAAPRAHEIRDTVDALLGEEIEALAVCFLHSYAHPEHEQLVAEFLSSAYPTLDYTLSHLVTQEHREFERTATTVVEAMIKRRLASYVCELESQLATEGFHGALLITRCDGGVMSTREVPDRSIRTLTSGPASGVMGAATMGRWLGIQNVLTADMGGTSFDAALIIDGEPEIQTVVEIERVPLLMPAIDVASVGAGGGSIASVDAGGALGVGPQSAGADPGPVCYGRGGLQPTFTDAALISGLISAESFLGGEFRLNREAAREVLATRIADPLGIPTIDAASGIVALTEAKMASLLEELTIGKGHDPRTFTLLAYGGGGPLVAGALASRLEIQRVIIPPSPATFSAWGMLTLDVVHDFARTAVGRLEELGVDDITRIFSELESSAASALSRECIPAGDRKYVRSIDMRYEDQEHAVTVRLPFRSLQHFARERLQQAFHERHAADYGYAMPNPVEVVAYRLRAIGLLEKPRRPQLEPGVSTPEVPVRARRWAVHHESGGRHEWNIYSRSALSAGSRVIGPAIIEEETTSTLVIAGQAATVDELGNLVLTPL